jgi:hypothetical protein
MHLVASLEVRVDVGCDHDGNVIPFFDRPPDPCCCRFVERSGRLIEQEQPWVTKKGSCKRKLLDHPGRATIHAPSQDLP